jgi:hypothetical protein
MGAMDRLPVNSARTLAFISVVTWLVLFSDSVVIAQRANRGGRGPSTGPAMTWGTPGIDVKPFIIDHRHAADSLIDLSFLHEGPAGKDGFIKVQNARFTTGNGKPIHFWGFNLTAWSNPGVSIEIPSKEDAPVFAAALSRYGVNLVRLHFLDQVARPVNGGMIDGSRDDSQHFDQRALDDEDFFIAELFKRGIYIDFNLFVGRAFKNGDNLLTSVAPGTTQPARGRGRGGANSNFGGGLIGKSELFFDKRGIELQKDYAKQWLTHVNPYTGKKYVDHAGLAIVEIINEATIDIGYNGGPIYNAELDAIYQDWLAKTQSPQTLAKLREITGVGADQPIPRLIGQPAVRSAPKEQYYVECDFFHHIKTSFFKEMSDYMKNELGLKCLVMGTADHGHSSSGYPITFANSVLDAVDGHDYWQAFGPVPDTQFNVSMLNYPLQSTIVELMRTPVAGKPYTVSEMGHTWPNQYAVEGAPLLAAYGAFQGTDMITWYTWEWKRDPNFPQTVGDRFDSHLDPSKMPIMAACAAMFIRGDVEQAKRTITRTYTRQQIWDSRLLPGTERPWFTPGYPFALPLIHGVRASFEGPETTIPNDIDTHPPFKSDTGQLVWDTGTDSQSATFTIDTPRSQALVGFLNSSPRAVSNLSADVKNHFAAIMVTALEDKPIAQAQRLLLVAAVRTENSNMQWDARKISARGGESPTLIEPVMGTITLKGLEGASGVSVTPLDGAGRAIGGAISARKAGADWEIPVGDPATPWYQVVITRPGA